MIPVLTENAETSGCVYKSAKCVLYEGPAISCLTDICADTSIQSIIHAIGEMVCNLDSEMNQDWNFLNVGCLVEEDQQEPVGQHEIISAIITKLCNIDNTGISKSLECPCEELTVFLEKCHTDPDDYPRLTNPVLISEAVERISDVTCMMENRLGNEINNNSSSIVNLTEIINNLTIPTTTYVEPTITAQCASGDTGEVLPITEAFETFESTFCNYIENIGTTEEIIEAINKQCDNLCSTPSCGNEKSTYCDLPGWVEEPTSLAESLNNLWIYTCDVNNCVTEEELPCVALPPINLSISYTGSTFVVTFDGHGSTAIQEPLYYNMKVYASDAMGNATGEPVIERVLISGNPTSNINLSEVQNYVVKVFAVYESCGVSDAVTYVGRLKTCTTQYQIYLRATSSSLTVDCASGTISEVSYTVVAELRTYPGNALVNNTTGNDISMDLVLIVNDPLLTVTVEEVYNLTIPHNSSSSNSLTYIATTGVDVGGTCTAFTRGNIQPNININNFSICSLTYNQGNTDVKPS